MAEAADPEVVKAALASREPEVHDRVVSLDQAQKLSIGLALDSTKGEATFHTPTGGSPAARPGYIYGAIAESQSQYPVLKTHEDGWLLPKRIMGDELDHFSAVPAQLDKMQARLPEGAHLIMVKNSKGITDRVMMVGMPADKVENALFRNGDGEVQIRPGSNSKGHMVALVTVTLDTPYSIHGGHERPKVQPAYKTTHAALAMGQKASPEDVAAITAAPPADDGLMIMAAVQSQTMRAAVKASGAGYGRRAGM